MASILGAVAMRTAGTILTDLITSKLTNRNKAVGPAAAVPPAVVAAAVKEAVGDSDEIAVVPVSKKSSINLGAIFGAAFTLLTFYGGDVIPGPVADALDTIGQAIGLPAKLVPALVIAGTFIFVFVRKTWFDHSITPAAADRAFEKGKVV